ncbi:MAG: site-2 protease family protein [Actinomycetota bacterium]|nr:site-2 protease family protein [Actinomycetota bacterium]
MRHWFEREHVQPSQAVSKTIPLGRIAGIPIGFNWSLLIVVGLLSWTFAVYEFPSDFPNRSTVFYWAAGLITTAAFFACLLAHEMAHALVARRLDVRVEGITLWLFGGVARIRGDDMTAKSELRIAAAGPLMSLLIAGLGWGGGRLLDAAGAPEIVASVVLWLGRINLMLALFNLIPAFPMDGGRIMRSLLWRRTGRARATRIASRTGQGFAFLLMCAGLVEASVGDPTGGLWLVFLGWFLSNAARSEEAPVPIERSLGNVRVRDVMNASPPTAPAWMTVDAFLQFAAGHAEQAFPLREIDGSTTGLANSTAVARLALRNPATVRLREVACRIGDVAVARPEELLDQVLARPARCAPGWILVLDDTGLVGLVGPADLVRGQELNARVERTATA